MTVNYAPEQTGIGAYTTSLANGLAARGFDVSVRTAAPHYPAWRIAPESEWSPAEVAEGVRITRDRSYVPARPNMLTRTLFEILYGLRFATRGVPDSDVVILVSPALLTSAIVRARLALGRNAPRTVLWLQDRYSAGVREIPGRVSRLAGRLIQAIEASLARSCDRVVVIHDRWCGEVTDQLHVPHDRLRAIRNWTHVTVPASVDVPATRRSLGWGDPGDEIVVLHSGNMGAKQGLENVVEAARYAEEQALPVRFVLIGDGNQRERLEQLGHGCAKLQFLRPLPQEQFLAALAAADVLLVNELPGLTETAVPSKLTSYFAAGRPVVAATESNSVTADEVRASGAGWVIPPGEPKVLTLTARDVPANSAGLNPEAGPAFVRQRLSQNAGIDAFVDLLRSLAIPDQGSASPSLPVSERKGQHVDA